MVLQARPAGWTTDPALASAIQDVEVAAYKVPTEAPEADGTLSWDATTYVVVHVRVGEGIRGLGFVAGHSALVGFISDVLVPHIKDKDVRNTDEIWMAMERAIRNYGRTGLSAMAVAAVDLAVHDAKARLLGQPLHKLLGATRSAVPIYGSGGFTSYHVSQLVAQCRGWVEQGIPAVKMKVGMDRGRHWREDVDRVCEVRRAIGNEPELFVDANGAYAVKQALNVGQIFAEEAGVTWFEEPVTSDDRAGLAFLREKLPMDVATGEYGYELGYFRDLLESGSIDVIQADIGRCAGISEWLRVAALAASWRVPISGHCQPAMHLAAAAAAPNLRHLEYFHDHVRAEQLLFAGITEPRGGVLPLRDDIVGNGLELKEQDAEAFRVA